MKYLKLFFLVVLFAVFIGTTTKEKTFTKGLKIGSLAPELNLQDFEVKNGKYVLLHFWAVYDGESRADNALMHNKITQLGLENLRMVSISLDEKGSVFEQAIRADRLDTQTQFNVKEGASSEIFKKYRLDKGFKTLLLDPDGVIIASNVEADQLVDVLNKKGVL